MLRVLKVPQDSPYLSAKELKNYEVNMLLSKYESRVSRQTSIGKQRKRLSKPDSMMSSSSSFQSSMSSDLTDVLLGVNEEMKALELSKSPGTEDDLSSICGSEIEDTTTDQELFEGDFDDVLCPICLLELVEGEDVVICINCENELHQHCMDIWANELQRREEETWCPLCRASWNQGKSSTTPAQKLNKPQTKDGGNPGFRQRVKSDATKITLREARLDKETLVAVLVEDLPKSSSEHLFAASWRTRESTLLRLRKSLLSSLVTKSGDVKLLSTQPCEQVVSACCGVAAFSCSDPVLKVYLASLELLRTLFSYCICSTESEQSWMRLKLKPAISILLTRCFDAQSRVKECSLQLLLDVCLGQDGPLASGCGTGQTSPFAVGGMSYVFNVLCEDPSQSLRRVSQWWMGRLVVLDHLMSKFEQHMTTNDPEESIPQASKSEPLERASKLMSKIFSRSESSSSCDSSGSIDLRGSAMWPSSSNDFLLMAITFAAKSTHIQNYKVYRLAKRIIMRAVKYLFLNQDIFISVLEGVSRCSGSVKNQWLRKVCKVMMEVRPDLRLSHSVMETFGNFGDIFEQMDVRRRTLTRQESPVDHGAQGNISNSDMEFIELESASDTDFKSVKKVPSTFADRSFQEGSPLSKESSITSSEQKMVQDFVEEAKITEQPTSTSTPVKKLAIHHQDTVTADDEQVIGHMLLCRKSVEQEEEEAFAKLMSDLPPEDPLPPLSGINPPGVEAVVYIQPGPLADQQDGEAVNVKEYVEKMHWTKGRVIGTGAYCTCFLARDVKSGTIMAVKQVSYCRNTPCEEEKELKRLKEEVAMLGRLRHPNIVRCLGATQVVGHFNIFVEWMAGGSVDQLISDFGPFDEAVIIKYLKQILLGVGYLHEYRAIHRDIKGANILVDSTGQRVRVADFGAAARLAAQVTGAGEFRNDMQGTVAFMAPEVVRGDHYGRRCDVWSIGCVVIQMATGSPPWGAKEATNSYALIYKVRYMHHGYSIPHLCVHRNPKNAPESYSYSQTLLVNICQGWYIRTAV
jgi:mitogen-activated protein kinase kinase kinase 1